MRRDHYNLPMSHAGPCHAEFRTGPSVLTFLCSSLLLLTSCAGLRHTGGVPADGGGRTAASPSKTSAVFITDRKTIELLPPSCMAGSMDQLQLFTGRYGTQSFSFQTYTRADAEGISMTLLNELGLEIGRLSYTKDGCNLQSAYLPDNIRAEYMLLDFQNCCYDADVLRERYAAAGLRFERSADAHGERRRIYDGRTLIEDIMISEARSDVAGRKAPSITVTNHLRSYRYELESLEEAAGEEGAE